VTATDPGPQAAGDGPAAAQPALARPVRAFALLGTIQVTLIFTITLIAVPLPAIGREFGLGRSGLVLLSTAYGLAFSGLLLLGGRLADRRGGRAVLTNGLAIFAASSALAALAPGFAALLAARFGEGIGAALAAPAAMTVLRAVLPRPDQQARALATWGGLPVLGATAGVLLSGVLTTWVSWRWMFAIAVLASLTALPLARRWLPAAAPGTASMPGTTSMPGAASTPGTASTPGAGLDLRGAVLATAGIVLLSYGLVRTGGQAWSTVGVLVPLIAGLALLAAFARAESRSRDPLLPLAFLRSPGRRTAMAAISLAAAGTAVVYLLMSLYFQQVRGWSPLRTSLAFLPCALSLAATGRIAARLVARLGPRATLVTGLATGAAGLLLLARLGPHTAYAPGVLPGLVLLPAGAGLTFAGGTVLAGAGVPPCQAGLAGGVINTAIETGPTVGVAGLVAVAAARTTAAAAGGAARAAATTDGYAWALGAAGLAFTLLALAAARPPRYHDPIPLSPIPSRRSS
jgi:MFS family permease